MKAKIAALVVALATVAPAAWAAEERTQAGDHAVSKGELGDRQMFRTES